MVFSELPRLRLRVDWASATSCVFKLASELWRPSTGKSSPNTFCRRLWKPPRLMLDLEPVLLTVCALATEGRRSSPACMGKPMLSSRLPVPGRAKPGDSWARSSVESSKKLLHSAGMLVPLLPDDHGAFSELALVAVGGTREMDGRRPPDVSSTASCLRWSAKGFGAKSALRGRCEASLGGGTGGRLPGEISDSLSMLQHGVSGAVSAVQ
jgi:hypothetical protein